MLPILIAIGPLYFYSYAVFIVLSWLVWSFMFWRYLRNQGTDEERIFDLTFYASLSSLVAARAVFVLTHTSLFSDNLLKIGALWIQSGLSFAAGLIGGLVAILFLAKRYKVRFGKILDSLAHSMPIALIIASIGFFLDGTQLGKVTKLPWGVRYAGEINLRHPVELYTIIAVLVLWFIVELISRRARWDKWSPGLVGVWWFFLLSFAMFMLEFLVDSNVYWASLTLAQWVMVGLFAESLGAFYVRGGGRDWLKKQGGGIYGFFKRKFRRTA